MSELGDVSVNGRNDDGAIAEGWTRGIGYRSGWSQCERLVRERGRGVRGPVFVGSDRNLSRTRVSLCKFTGFCYLQISNLNGTLTLEFVIQPDEAHHCCSSILSLMSFVLILWSFLVSFHFCKFFNSKLYTSTCRSHFDFS